MSRPKSDIDWQVYSASKIPGPGDYNTIEPVKVSGGRFSTARPKSAVETLIRMSSQIPGPGHYNVPSSSGIEGGRMSNANPKTEIEWTILRAKDIPGPGQYNVRRDLKTSGGKFNMSRPKSEIDWVMYTAAQRPGPQQYQSYHTPKIGGGKFSTARPKTELDWIIYKSKEEPGPGDYNVNLLDIARMTGSSRQAPEPEARSKTRKSSGESQKQLERSNAVLSSSLPLTEVKRSSRHARPLRPQDDPGVPDDPRKLLEKVETRAENRNLHGEKQALQVEVGEQPHPATRHLEARRASEEQQGGDERMAERSHVKRAQTHASPHRLFHLHPYAARVDERTHKKTKTVKTKDELRSEALRRYQIKLRNDAKQLLDVAMQNEDVRKALAHVTGFEKISQYVEKYAAERQRESRDLKSNLTDLDGSQRF
mmetsp:Transcript_12033/g.41768  ORF Transcript_12033/g.41768 Transcript_12033/m.41768 type:complete len:424 (+) Transcript_12033:548-1819(+)